MASESKVTVYYAVGANLMIAVAKLGGGLISGSAAMLAEAAHSLADTMNQVFMLVSLSLGKRPASEEHPFGYGKERFFWAFLAAVFIFVSGAVFSIGEGVRDLMSGEEPDPSTYLISYIILMVAFAAEATSWLRALKQVRGQARAAGLPLVRFVRVSRDPTVKTVLSEDSVALVGLVLALVGIALHQLTGNRVWDAGASIAIGVLLAFVAYALGRDTKGLLLGEAARPEERAKMHEVLAERQEIARTIELLTMALGPSSMLVAARVDLHDGLSGAAIERMSGEIDDELRQVVPSVTQVFVDATSRSERNRSDAAIQGR